MRFSAQTSVLGLLSSFAFACASGEPAPQTPQSTTTVDLDPKKPEAKLSPEEAAREEAAKAGILGVLNADGTGVAAGFGPGGLDDSDVWGGLTGTEIGEASGAGGLGLVGTGRGGGGTGEGTIGLGNVGTIGKGGGGGTGQGYGTGSGRLGGSHRATPKVTAGSSQVTGSLPKEVIQRIVRRHYNRLRYCYETGLQKDPTLAGKVTTKFTIGPDGTVSAAKSEGSLKDAVVLGCVEKTFRTMAFPKPDKGGIVVVSYPVVFAPGDAAASSSAGAASAPASSAPATSEQRIAGKPLAEVAVADLEKALKDAGMTSITRADHPSIKGASVLSAAKGQKQYTITFVPTSAASKALPTEEQRRMESGAGIEKDGFALIIAGPDQASAKALLDALTSKK